MTSLFVSALALIALVIIFFGSVETASDLARKEVDQ